MIKTIRICDWCGKEITGETYYNIAASFISEGAARPPRNYDYCPECGDRFTEVLAGAMPPAAKDREEIPAVLLRTAPQEAPQEAAPAEDKKKGGRKKIKLDLGKVGALYRAGWTIAKIADEMGVGSSTIQRALAQIQEENNG